MIDLTIQTDTMAEAKQMNNKTSGQVNNKTSGQMNNNKASGQVKKKTYGQKKNSWTSSSATTVTSATSSSSSTRTVEYITLDLLEKEYERARIPFYAVTTKKPDLWGDEPIPVMSGIMPPYIGNFNEHRAKLGLMKSGNNGHCLFAGTCKIKHLGDFLIDVFVFAVGSSKGPSSNAPLLSMFRFENAAHDFLADEECLLHRVYAKTIPLDRTSRQGMWEGMLIYASALFSTLLDAEVDAAYPLIPSDEGDSILFPNHRGYPAHRFGSALTIHLTDLAGPKATAFPRYLYSVDTSDRSHINWKKAKVNANGILMSKTDYMYCYFVGKDAAPASRDLVFGHYAVNQFELKSDASGYTYNAEDGDAIVDLERTSAVGAPTIHEHAAALHSHGKSCPPVEKDIVDMATIPSLPINQYGVIIPAATARGMTQVIDRFNSLVRARAGHGIDVTMKAYVTKLGGIVAVDYINGDVQHISVVIDDVWRYLLSTPEGGARPYTQASFPMPSTIEPLRNFGSILAMVMELQGMTKVPLECSSSPIAWNDEDAIASTRFACDLHKSRDQMVRNLRHRLNSDPLITDDLHHAVIKCIHRESQSIISLLSMIEDPKKKTSNEAELIQSKNE